MFEVYISMFDIDNSVDIGNKSVFNLCFEVGRDYSNLSLQMLQIPFHCYY